MEINIKLVLRVVYLSLSILMRSMGYGVRIFSFGLNFTTVIWIYILS